MGLLHAGCHNSLPVYNGTRQTLLRFHLHAHSPPVEPKPSPWVGIPPRDPGGGPLRAFTAALPLLLASGSAPVSVELSNLCSGKLFGAIPSGQHQLCSAIADTRVELFSFSRADVRSHMGPEEPLASLWSAQPDHGSADKSIGCVRGSCCYITHVHHACLHELLQTNPCSLRSSGINLRRSCSGSCTRSACWWTASSIRRTLL